MDLFSFFKYIFIIFAAHLATAWAHFLRITVVNKTGGKTPWMKNQIISRPRLTQDNTQLHEHIAYPWFEQDSMT
jgi:hypothetical protein